MTFAAYIHVARKWALLIGVNLLVVVLLLGICEGAARYYETHHETGIKPLELKFYPYVMYTSPLPEDLKGKWGNSFTGEETPTTMSTNNLGFTADFDFTLTPSDDYLKKYGKHAGERIVLLTGGSAAAGVGATSNAMTIGQRMEQYLNSAQHKIHYRVINLSMTGWISYQEFIALDLFGSQFDPDWVVIMDGSNDAAAACRTSAGAGNPIYWPMMLYFLHGRSLDSVLEDYLVQHSALFRVVTGKQYIKPVEPPNMYYDAKERVEGFRIKLPLEWSAIGDQLGFYMRAQRSMLRLYQNAKYILSTQPTTMPLIHGDLYYEMVRAGDPRQKKAYAEALTRSLQELFKEQQHAACGEKARLTTQSYLLPASAIKLEDMAEDARQRHWRDVRYENPMTVLPTDDKERQKYFIDIVHLKDAGQDILGKFYARKILERDGFAKEADAL